MNEGLRSALAAEIAAQEEEQRFRVWYAAVSKMAGVDPDPDAPEHFYDWRGAFRAGDKPIMEDDGLYHFSSRFKRKGHPNRFVRTDEGIIDTITGELIQ